MSPKRRCLMIGAGSMGVTWMRQIWAPFRDRMEFAALVDVSPAALHAAGDWLGLPDAARFTSAREALATVEADFCCVVTPPACHREAVELACARGMDILSEKPIAGTWEDCRAIYRAVRAAGVKMLVTQNYRYTPRILTLKQAVRELGPVNYAVARYASDYRVRGSWGPFRHELRHALLVDASIHHLDQLRNLCEANCLAIAGWDWNPGQTRGDVSAWRGSDSFDHEPCGLFILRMDNGSFASYEGNSLATGKTNTWSREYYRVECEGGVAVLDGEQGVLVETRGPGGTLERRELPGIVPRWEGHQAIAAQFLDWLDGGPTPATALEDNIQSAATVFAAIRASETGNSVNVQEMVREAIGESPAV